MSTRRRSDTIADRRPIESSLRRTNDQIVNYPERRWIPILFNPSAGPASRSSLIAELSSSLKAKGFEPEIITDQATFAERVRDPAALRTCRCLGSAGGDGTLQWTVNLLVDAPLAIIPIGSENLLATYLKIPRDPIGLAEMIERRRVERKDLGVVNGRRFTLMTSAGFDSAIVQEVHANRRGHVSRWAYVRTTLKSIFSLRWPSIEVRLDDRTSPIVATHVFVFNAPKYALGLPVCGEADLADGWFDVLIFRSPGRRAAIKYLVTVLFGIHRRLDDVEHHRAKRVELKSRKRTYLQADGDPIGELPAVIEIIPAGIEYVVPSD
jgi:diacylglycerol kinase family enzyme